MLLTFVKRFLFHSYIYIISLFITFSAIASVRKLDKRLLFINYRAFGHSIIDSFGVYDFYGQKSFILSLGERFERNVSLYWIIPSECLKQFLLPSWHRLFKTTSRLSIRKYVGPCVFNLLTFSKNLGILNREIVIRDQNQQIMLDVAPKMLNKYLGWDKGRCDVYLNHRINTHNQNGISESNGVGTQVYMSIVNRISDENLEIDSAIQDEFLNLFGSRSVRQDGKSFRLFTLILSSRGKPHHGNGLTRYVSSIEYILQSEDCYLVILGDYAKDMNLIRHIQSSNSRLLIPEDFSIKPQLVPFLAIRNAETTFGDPSGLWALFVIIGSKGIVIDQIPSGELFNRCLHIPRVWENEKGQLASQDFILGDALFRLNKFEFRAEFWTPRLHSSSELEVIFFSRLFLNNSLLSNLAITESTDDLFLFLLNNKICGIHIL